MYLYLCICICVFVFVYLYLCICIYQKYFTVGTESLFSSSSRWPLLIGRSQWKNRKERMGASRLRFVCIWELVNCENFAVCPNWRTRQPRPPLNLLNQKENKLPLLPFSSVESVAVRCCDQKHVTVCRFRCNHWIIVGAPDYSVSIYQVKPNPAVFEKLYLYSSSLVFEYGFWYSPIWDIYIEYQQASWFNFFCISIILLLVFVHCCHCICAFLLCIGVPP